LTFFNAYIKSFIVIGRVIISN